jgi:hypothetical protein
MKASRTERRLASEHNQTEKEARRSLTSMRERRSVTLFCGGYKVVAELNNADNNECRHSWSEQEIHGASFPRVWICNRKNPYDLAAGNKS